MKTTLTIGAAITAIVVAFVPEVVDAQAGHMHRATRRRTAVVVSSATKSASSGQVSQAQQQTAAAQQQAATAEQQAAAANQKAAAAEQQAAAAQAEAAAARQAAATAAPASAAAGQPLPLGAVVSRLPAGCVSTPVGGVEYDYCGGNFYRAMFQENTLVYVTVKPK